MIHAFNSAALGLKSYQIRLDVRANNMANANTAGYKAQDAGFSDALYSNTVTGEGDILQTGNGVRLSMVSGALEQGALKKTGRDFDAAIEGDGYFCVQGANGGLFFTRAGNFTPSGGFLATPEGHYVLDGGFERIRIYDDAGEVTLAAGSESKVRNNGQTIFLGVFTFQNPYALGMEGSGLLSANAQSGAPRVNRGALLKQGYLEASSVDLSAEMAGMIEAQRGFQANARMLQTADNIEEMSNNLRT